MQGSASDPSTLNEDADDKPDIFNGAIKKSIPPKRRSSGARHWSEFGAGSDGGFN
jgi:hypothetical protein